MKNRYEFEYTSNVRKIMTHVDKSNSNTSFFMIEQENLYQIEQEKGVYSVI